MLVLSTLRLTELFLIDVRFHVPSSRTLPRTIAIGDVHGCSKALRSIVEAIAPEREDTLVLLGDYIDRGPDARGVIEILVDLQQSCNLVPLRGNHEIMLSSILRQGVATEHWLQSGGQATLASYGGRLARIPDQHLEFFAKLLPFYETEKTIFVHASYDPLREMKDQDEQMLFWNHLLPAPPPPHCSGKKVIVGHTPQGSGMPLDLSHLVCLDTYCFGGLWLSALDLDSRELWQTSYHGHLRRRPLQALLAWSKHLRFFNARRSNG